MVVGPASDAATCWCHCQLTSVRPLVIRRIIRKGIRAGDISSLPLQTLSLFKRSVDWHAWQRTNPSPWISLTADLLPALNRSWQHHCKGKTVIIILIIDSQDLQPGNFMKSNPLRKLVGLEPCDLFDTEVLVWQNIPAAAVLSHWPWEALQKSDLFELFPTLPTEDPKQALTSLRNSLGNNAMDLDEFLERLLPIRVNNLEMDPDSWVTTRVAMLSYDNPSATEMGCSLFELSGRCRN
jgi:hypothetical protein